MTSRLVVDALEMAVARRLPGEDLLAHSDRGSQYASEHCQQLLGKHGIECSMSEVGQCWDNAPAESFFASLNNVPTTTRAAAKHCRGAYNRPSAGLRVGLARTGPVVPNTSRLFGRTLFMPQHFSEPPRP